MQHRHDLEEKVVSAVRGFANSINSSRKIVADMSSLVEVTSQLPLSNLDYWERLIRSEFFTVLEIPSQPKWKVWSKPTQILTWIDLISWNGYKREKALRTLTGAAPNRFFFALAVRRLNDWVPQVRKAARETLPLIAKESDPTLVADVLCISLSHWNSWGRIEESDKKVLLEIISSNAISLVLKSKIISSTSGPMTTLLSQVGRTSVLDTYLDDIAHNSIQPSVRAKAYRSQLEGRMIWVEGWKWKWTDIQYCKGRLSPIISERKLTLTPPFLEVLKNASTDRSSIVRRVAAEFLIREFSSLGDEAIRMARMFVSDPSPAVSERGKFALKQQAQQQI